MNRRTRVFKISRKRPAAAQLAMAADVLCRGGVVVFPTDTVYGVAVNAFDARARKKVYALKGRSYSKPLTIMVPDIACARMFAEVSKDAGNFMEKFWPGPLTLVLPATHFGSIVMNGRNNIGIRIPDDKVVAGILSAARLPLATTSANPSHHKSARTGDEAARYFDGKVDMILDAGPCPHKMESTVIDMLHFPYVVLREGSLPSKKLLQYL